MISVGVNYLTRLKQLKQRKTRHRLILAYCLIIRLSHSQTLLTSLQ